LDPPLDPPEVWVVPLVASDGAVTLSLELVVELTEPETLDVDPESVDVVGTFAFVIEALATRSVTFGAVNRA